MADRNFPPSIPLCKLYERTSKRGNTYLTGRLGAARVTILKTDQADDDGNSIWSLMLQEAPPTQQRSEQAKRAPKAETAMRGSQRPLEADASAPWEGQ